MEQNINLLRTGFCITQRCTLKCKLCLAYIPYYEDPKDVSLIEATIVLKQYFDLVDKVDVFTVTGGEPLLNRELYEIMSLVYNYANQINKSIDFVTNGTLELPQRLLRLFAEHADKTKVIVSDYGKLSTKINTVVKQLKENGITYRISKLHGDNMYFDGWIDFTNHDKKIFDIEERDRHGEQCIHKAGKYYLINEGELHNCSRSYWRMREGIIPKTEGEYVSLIDSTSIEKKKENLKHMFEKKSVTSCGHCVGLRNDVPRVNPAEQVREGE